MENTLLDNLKEKSVSTMNMKCYWCRELREVCENYLGLEITMRLKTKYYPIQLVHLHHYC